MKIQKNKDGKSSKTSTKKDGQGNDTSSIQGAAFNLCLSVLGAGIVVMPFALRETGFGLGIILIIFLAAVTIYTLHLQIHAAKLCNCDSYVDVGLAAFGKPGYYLVAVLQFLYPFIGMIAFAILVTDQISRLLVGLTGIDGLDELQSHFWGTRPFITAVYLILFLPLSLYRNIARLSKWAVVSLAAILLLIIFFSIRLGTLNLPPTPNAYKFADIEFVQGVGIIATAYVCHDTSLLIYDSLYDNTERRWDKATNIGIVLMMLCNLIVGIVGYVTFTGNSLGDVLENYCNDDVLITIGRLFFALAVMIAFPLNVFVDRSIIEKVIFSNSGQSPLYRHVLETILITAAVYSVTLATDCIGFVQEISGVLISMPLGLILPPVLVMKLQAGPLCSRQTFPMWLVLFVGVFFMVAGITVTIKELLENGLECDKPSEAPFC